MERIGKNFANNNQEYVRNKKEIVFKTLVESRLIESFIKEMKEQGFSEFLISNFREEVSKLDNSDFEKLIASPWRLKKIFFEKNKTSIESGEKSISDLVNEIVEINRRFDRAYAYHCSQNDIKPKEVLTPSGKSLEWVVAATENDHRDGDLPRAYMSFDYQSLYRDKNPKFLYIVGFREDPKSGFVYNKSRDGGWGRAYSLDIIDKLDLVEIESELDEIMKEESAPLSENRKRA